MMRMTSTPSPKDLLAAYRQSARESAAASGRPEDRSAFPGLGTAPTGMIYLREGKHLTFRSFAERKSVPLMPELLDSLLTEELKSTVIADASTHARLTVMADNMPASDFKSLSRRLRISRSLPVSQKLPILTEALAYRYWLQEGLSDDLFEDWCTAFDLDGLSTAAQMEALIEQASDGVRSEKFKYPKVIAAMEILEHKILENCTYSSISTDCYVYSMLEQYGVKANSLRTLDPGLLEMHAIDGQVCRVTPMEMRAESFTAAVSTPFKFKEGAQCNLTDGHETSAVIMESLRYGGGTLHAQFSQPSSRNNGAALIARARSGHAALYAVEIPFESFGKALKNRRWLGDPVEAVQNRQVPMDVVLAGAQTE